MLFRVVRPMKREGSRIPMFVQRIPADVMGRAVGRRAGKGNTAAIAMVSANADQRARDLAEVVKHIRASGAVTLECHCQRAEWPRDDDATRRRWYPSSVANLLRRLEA